MVVGFYAFRQSSYRTGCAVDEVMVLAIFIGTIFAIILTTYFVKVARRLCSLMHVLQREAEWRIRVNYDLPGPMPLQKGKFDDVE